MGDDLINKSSEELLRIGEPICRGHVLSFTTQNSPIVSWDARTRAIRALDDVVFLLGLTPTPVAPEYCLSLRDVIGIATFF